MVANKKAFEQMKPEFIVPFGDFLERRKERYGAAFESARKDVEGNGK